MINLVTVVALLGMSSFQLAGAGINQEDENMKFSLTDNLKYYETFDTSQLSHNIVKRGADPSRYAHQLHTSLNRTYFNSTKQ